MSDIPAPLAKRPRKWKRYATGLVVFLLVWFIIAYILLPIGWERYGRRHPSLDDIPTITRTGDDIPGDPLNVALVGTEEEVQKIMHRAKWYPADEITFKSSLRIAVDSVLKRSYDEAPVSNLYLFGRKQDLAFEQPVGDDPRQRNHVRFWKTPKLDEDGRPLWVGSATYDKRVGLSHTTGQITHHIGPDIDVERDHLFKDLKATGDLASVDIITGFQKKLEGRNGGGDPWHSDGDLYVGIISIRNTP